MEPVFNCIDCDSEFTVEPTYDTEDPISFCPYCGSEINHEEEEDLEDEDFRD